MTKKEQLLLAYKKVERTESKLMLLTQELSRIASEYLGFDVDAQLCNGSEIEFRIVCKDGVSDDKSTICLEDILNGKQD